jgi:hypothetical protein
MKELFRQLTVRFHNNADKTVGGVSSFGTRTFVHTDVGMIYSNTEKGICVYYLERLNLVEPLVGSVENFLDDMVAWKMPEDALAEALVDVAAPEAK